MNNLATARHVFRGARLASLIILGLCEFVRGALLFSILPIYVVHVLGLSPEIVGYAIAAHYFLDTSLRSPAGWFIDRYGQKLVLLIALSVGWLGLCMIIRAHQNVTVILGSGWLGIGMAFVWPAVISRVTSGMSAEHNATAMSGVIMAWLTGSGLGAVSMSFLLGDHMTGGFIGLLSFWLCAVLLSIFAMSSKRILGMPSKTTYFRQLISDLYSVRLLFPGMFVQTFAMGVLLPVFVLYARYQLGLDGKMYSSLLVAAGAATVLLQIPVGRFVDRQGYKPYLISGFILSSIMLPIIVQMHTLPHLFLAVVGLGAAYAFILPSWNSVLAHSVTPQRRAVMWGVFMTVEGLGMAIGPLVGTQLWRNVNPTAPFYAAAFILLLMAAFYTFAPLEKVFQTSVSEESQLHREATM